MGFLKEFRQRRRVAKWRKLRVRLHALNLRIDELEDEMLDADLLDLDDFNRRLGLYRRQRNSTLRRLNELEVKETANVQA